MMPFVGKLDEEMLRKRWALGHPSFYFGFCAEAALDSDDGCVVVFLCIECLI
jgi:hypothetical protein